MKRAMTLVETLLALALLPLVLVAAFGWSATLVRSADAGGRQVRDAAGVDAVLTLIADDLRVGDRAPTNRREDPRVRAGEDQLAIATRAPGIGPLQRVYRRTRDARLLRDERLLLTGVNGFEALEVEPGWWSITVTIDETSVTRELRAW